MDDEHLRVPFLAPVFAAMTAPAAEIGRALARAMMPATEVVTIRCPRARCGRVIGVWWKGTELLYPPPRDDRLGSALSASRTANVGLRCGRCRRTWHISGRAIGRNLANGRPPLG